MSCLDIQEAPGRQAVGSVQAGRPEAGQAVCVQQPGESPLQRLETLSARQQEEQKAIMEVSLQKTGKTPMSLMRGENCHERQAIYNKRTIPALSAIF